MEGQQDPCGANKAQEASTEHRHGREGQETELYNVEKIYS